MERTQFHAHYGTLQWLDTTRGPTVDDVNPASPNISYTSIVPIVLCYTGSCRLFVSPTVVFTSAPAGTLSMNWGSTQKV